MGEWFPTFRKIVVPSFSGLLDREGEGSNSANGTASLARRLGYSATLL